MERTELVGIKGRSQLTANDYEKIIRIIGEKFMLSIKRIQSSIETMQLTSNDEEFNVYLDNLMRGSEEIEKDMYEASIKYIMQSHSGFEL